MASNLNKSAAALLIVGSSNVYSFDKPIIRIGRLEDNDLIIDDPRISRYHAELRYHEGHFQIVDMNSTGGTFVNGVKINGQVLDKGDVITLAGIHLVFGQDEFPTSETTSSYKHPKIKPQKNLHTMDLSPDTITMNKPDEE
jgi:pSer/pThr/pTyr-binding forkhead associated (FHA) protein